LVVQAPLIRSRDTVDPLQIWDPQGESLFSFAATPLGGRDPSDPRVRLVTLSPIRDDEVWIARLDGYRLERWNLDGTLDLVLERDAPWFDPWRAPDPHGVEGSRQSRVTSVWEDADAHLWVVGMTRDSEWEPVLDSAHGTVALLRDWSLMYDTVIEVLDPLRQVVMARARFDQVLLRVLGSHDLVFSTRSAGGERYESAIVDVWRLVVRR
jgi:hypothetical protein